MKKCKRKSCSSCYSITLNGKLYGWFCKEGKCKKNA